MRSWTLPSDPLDSTRAGLGRRPERQVHEQVLRLHLDGAVGAASEPEIDRAALHLRRGFARVEESEAKEEHEALELVRGDGLAAIEGVQDRRSVDVQADVPAPALVVDARARLDRDPYAREVRYPALQHRGQSTGALASRGKVEHETVELIAKEIERGILVAHHIHLHLRRGRVL